MGPQPETLTQRVNLLRESLRVSHSTTHQMVSKLSTFDHRLSALDDAIRPVMVTASSMRKAHENIGKTLNTADAILTRFEVFRQAEAKINRGPHNDLQAYLVAIDLLRSNVDFFVANKNFKNAEGMVSHFNNLLVKAVLKLEEEFRLVLSTHSMSLKPEDLADGLPNSSEPPLHMPDSGSTPTTNDVHRIKDLEKLICIPPKDALLLRDLVQQLIQAKHQMQCLKIYRDIRASTLEQSLRKLGLETLHKDDVQTLPWEVLETKIRNWIHIFQVMVKYLFFVERKVSAEVFKDFESLREQSFAEVTSNSMQILIGFAEAVTKSKVLPEKIFALLDMYKSMQDLQKDMEMLFEGKAHSAMRNSVLRLMRRLSHGIIETLTSFENRIQEERTKAPTDGRVHPMTSYVINYLKYLLDYLPALEQIFRNSSTGNDSNSQLENMVMRLTQALEINLEAKSKQYKDPALACLFLMNNIHYMVSFVRGSEAKTLLGNDWVDRHRRIVQQNANQYRRVAWVQVIGSLTTQGLGSSGSDGGNSSNSLRELVRERFRSFNTQFEEIQQRQSQWAVRDSELADNLRLSVSEILLPAYRAFMQRSGPLIENTRNYEKFVRYTPDAIDRMVGELFRGGDR